ncbi:unknown protein [Seminavis robusta]|uniref:U-box domain-containing protein n=1 Tax=Seminavis robusta TaxID=568900 RepID=A0A9N8EAP8_9STRA|nr:unknown protein [Seminavis robusta]
MRDLTPDFICPITKELPWVAVIAQDGRTYEKEAIEQYFKTQQEEGLPIKSYITNEPMGTELVDVPRNKSLIESLIDRKVIQGPELVAWNKKVEQVKEKDKLLQRANGGDGQAMYSAGINGFEKNLQLAYAWYKKSHEAGNVKGTACLGQCLVRGLGVTNKVAPGMHCLTHAANNGSDYAAYTLGKAFAKGYFGLPVNKKEAMFWLAKSVGVCTHSHMSGSFKVVAQKELDELVNSQEDSDASSTDFREAQDAPSTDGRERQV